MAKKKQKKYLEKLKFKVNTKEINCDWGFDPYTFDSFRNLLKEFEIESKGLCLDHKLEFSIQPYIFDECGRIHIHLVATRLESDEEYEARISSVEAQRKEDKMRHIEKLEEQLRKARETYNND